ncbi:MAG: electron transfer flavoprotein subunit beta/FixA family protein [Candidatus Brocadiae bacterium]|nr:electron transfer flavoprotein subunit beta/FixA family protein [Candidatus Brocadiia bacterium]
MNIVACIKRVPDSSARIKISADGKSIDPAGVEFVLNPYDEFAVEEALRLKEKAGTGEIAVIALGGPESAETLRNKVLAMGADRAVLLKESTAGRDPIATAQALAAEIKSRPADVVFFGIKAIDDDGAQVAALTATLLGWPCVAGVTKLEWNGRKVTAHRPVEGGTEIVDLELPAVFSAQKGLNDPRFPNIKGIMAAKKKPLEEKPALPGEPRLQLLSLENPPSRPAPRIVGQGKDAVPALVKLLREEARVI